MRRRTRASFDDYLLEAWPTNMIRAHNPFRTFFFVSVCAPRVFVVVVQCGMMMTLLRAHLIFRHGTTLLVDLQVA